MYERLAKLAILGGFGLRVVTFIISFFINIFSPDYGYYEASSISFVNILWILLGVVGNLAIIGGFALLFLLRPNLVDLAMGGAFALALFQSLLDIVLIKYLAVSAHQYAIISAIIGLIYITALLLWAFKMKKTGKPLAAIAIFAAVFLSYGGSFLNTLTGGTILYSLGNIAAQCGLAFAAYIDYNS